MARVLTLTLFNLFFYLSSHADFFIERRNIKLFPEEELGKINLELTAIGLSGKLPPNDDGIVNEFGSTFGSVINSGYMANAVLNVPILSRYYNLNFYHMMLLKPREALFGLGVGYGIEYQVKKFTTKREYKEISCSIPYINISSCPANWQVVRTARKYEDSSKRYINPFVIFRVEFGVDAFSLFTDFQYSYHKDLKKKSLNIGLKISL